MQTLVLIRHGESEGNTKGILTGQLDVPLTPAGRNQAEKTGQNIRDLGIVFDAAYTSRLQRARQTLNIVASQLHQPIPKILEDAALNERNFGDYTGAVKTSLQNELGDLEYKRVVKSWDVAAPHGESLRDVQLRALAYLQTAVMNDLREGMSVLISSHHQTLRAIIKHIEGIADDDINTLSIKNGEPIIYSYDPAMRSLRREYRDLHVTA